jgi:hypothetical protein
MYPILRPFLRGNGMRLQHLIALSIFSTILVGCNGEVGSSRNNKYQAPQKSEEKTTTYSGIFRRQNTTQVTYKTETASGATMNNLHPNPDILFDDDGSDGRSVSNRDDLTRPTTPCGLNPADTLAQKITDCVDKNKDLATWDGKVHATAGESTWNLVSLVDTTSGLTEIWYDQRTQMVWSAIVATEVNWCQAAGSIEGVSETVGTPCSSLSKGQDTCGDLNLAENPKIRWRLPTRNDYLQADIDGLRFVVKKTMVNFWTATVSSDVKARNKAWGYNVAAANLMAEEMTVLRPVRCIGTSNF